MHIFRAVESLSQFLEESEGRVGFVPTMGALHQGHLELVKEAKSKSDIVVVSVYVNPTQFNNPDDLKNYPRDEEGDRSKLESAGCDVLWFPQESDMYPDGVHSEQFDLGILENVMEGSFRPGHYQGVATIVDRLFSAVRPDVAIFGEKDFQQVAVIRRMAELKSHPTEIFTASTIREKDGLAMSSRNLLLEPNYREASPVIYKAMKRAGEDRENMSPDHAKAAAIREIQSSGLDVEYVEIVDSSTLSSIVKWDESEEPRIFVAAYAGKVRLIDNLKLN
ncbi:MAG: pantoate--beta-alanine ligase [Flavobacteriia bacterium]|nr:pantoate--beta-alanine ligase [Flavobacteriia bacterium]